MQNHESGVMGASAARGQDGAGRTGEAADKVRGKLGEAKDSAAEQAESRLAQQKSRVSDALSDVAQSLLGSGRQLRDQQHSSAGQYIERAAEEVERVARYLDDHSVSDLVHDVEDIARRQPAVFVGGALAAGFLAARFLKSSERRQHEAGTRDLPAVQRGYVDEPIRPREIRTDDISGRRTDHGATDTGGTFSTDATGTRRFE